jgi:hypothetical protein
MKRRTQAKRRTRAAKTVRRAGKVRRRRHKAGRPERRRKLTQRARARRNVDRPQTAKQFFAMSKQDRDEWEKVTSVVSEARATRKSPRKIAKRLGIEFKTVLRMTGRVIRKRNGRYVAQSTDKLLRVLVIPTKKGLREIATRDSRQASLIAEYWIAVSRYLDTGDASALRKFEGKRVVDANGKRVRLLTDLAELDRLGNAGVLSFETVYARR